MLFNILTWLPTEQISIDWSNTTLSDIFMYQFAQLVLEFIDFFFMCKFGAPENKFIAMLIIFYFFNSCYFMLYFLW